MAFDTRKFMTYTRDFDYHPLVGHYASSASIKNAQDKLSQGESAEISSAEENKSNFNGVFSYIRSKVSQSRRRLKTKKYDFDLVYVTSRIVAMGFPSAKWEIAIRNDRSKVKEFLDTYHRGRYMVFNLCAESSRQYSPSVFDDQLITMPFKDHYAPSITLMLEFCLEARRWLLENEENVVVVHCKAGKGRTGTMICALLYFLGVRPTINEVLDVYAFARSKIQEGVTIPSQILFVRYFSAVVDIIKRYGDFEGLLERLKQMKSHIILPKVFGMPFPPPYYNQQKIYLNRLRLGPFPSHLIVKSTASGYQVLVAKSHENTVSGYYPPTSTHSITWKEPNGEVYLDIIFDTPLGINGDCLVYYSSLNSGEQEISGSFRLYYGSFIPYIPSIPSLKQHPIESYSPSLAMYFSPCLLLSNQLPSLKLAAKFSSTSSNDAIRQASTGRPRREQTNEIELVRKESKPSASISSSKICPRIRTESARRNIIAEDILAPVSAKRTEDIPPPFSARREDIPPPFSARREDIPPPFSARRAEDSPAPLSARREDIPPPVSARRAKDSLEESSLNRAVSLESKNEGEGAESKQRRETSTSPQVEKKKIVSLGSVSVHTEKETEVKRAVNIDSPVKAKKSISAFESRDAAVDVPLFGTSANLAGMVYPVNSPAKRSVSLYQNGEENMIAALSPLSSCPPTPPITNLAPIPSLPSPPIVSSFVSASTTPTLELGEVFVKSPDNFIPNAHGKGLNAQLRTNYIKLHQYSAEVISTSQSTEAEGVELWKKMKKDKLAKIEHSLLTQAEHSRRGDNSTSSSSSDVEMDMGDVRDMGFLEEGEERKGDKGDKGEIELAREASENTMGKVYKGLNMAEIIKRDHLDNVPSSLRLENDVNTVLDGREVTRYLIARNSYDRQKMSRGVSDSVERCGKQLTLRRLAIEEKGEKEESKDREKEVGRDIAWKKNLMSRYSAPRKIVLEAVTPSGEEGESKEKREKEEKGEKKKLGESGKRNLQWGGKMIVNEDLTMDRRVFITSSITARDIETLSSKNKWLKQAKESFTLSVIAEIPY